MFSHSNKESETKFRLVSALLSNGSNSQKSASTSRKSPPPPKIKAFGDARNNPSIVGRYPIDISASVFFDFMGHKTNKSVIFVALEWWVIYFYIGMRDRRALKGGVMKDNKGKVWVAVSGYEVVVCTTLKGISEETGLSYNTMKTRKEEVFTMVSGKRDGGLGKVWFVVRKEVRKVEGRGINRIPGIKVLSGGFRIIE